jgi:hypothetical protein
MFGRSKPTATVAILFAAGVLAAAGIRSGPAEPPEPLRDGVTFPTPAQAALLACREHASMLHDVQWAAACVAHAQAHDSRRSECLRKRGADAAAFCDMILGEPDDSPDCMLPDSRAGSLNADLAAAESRCLQEANAEGNAGRVTRFAWLRQ